MYDPPRKRPTFGIEQLGDAELVVGDPECIVEVVDVVVFLQLGVLDEVGAVGVDEGVEAKAVAPTRAEVFYLYPSVPAQTDSNDTLGRQDSHCGTCFLNISVNF